MTDRNYDDIIDLPCPTSERHPRMSRQARAAQFAPFAALNGYENSIVEAARLTERERELGEDMADRLNRWQKMLSAIVDAKPRIRVVYFVADSRKRGGSYRTAEARLIGFSSFDKTITLDSGVTVPIVDIKSLDSELFEGMVDEIGD